ncbi:MAG TPA: hypothetical protein VFC00_18225 [Micromonosporaceae bacterium]|nr:hypothetical protein [Micromonosporaceae bacterium]
MAALGIVERAYRGALEKQFFDGLYLAAELNRQLGGLEILLRGPAVGCAARTGAAGSLRFGDRVVRTLSDPPQGVRRLLADGIPVWVEEPDLVVLGLADDGVLWDGVRRVAAGALAARWAEFRMVFYL